jgi:hypothetical protein
VNRLIQKIDPEKAEKFKYATPGTPRFKIQRPTEDMEIFNVDHQKKYCSGVIILLYLAKYSLPVVYNIILELSKSID